MVLAGGMLLSLAACSDKEQATTELTTPVEASDGNESIAADPTTVDETSEQKDSIDSMLIARAGAYERNGNYLVIDEQGNITYNGKPCEKTGEKPEDEYGNSYVFFDCQGISCSIMIDKIDTEYIYSDCGFEDRTINSFAPIAMSDVPDFDSQETELAEAEPQQNQQLWIQFGNICIYEMPISPEKLEADGWEIEDNGSELLTTAVKGESSIFITFADSDKSKICEITLSHYQDDPNRTISSDLPINVFGTTPIQEMTADKALNVLDKDRAMENSEYEVYSTSDSFDIWFFSTELGPITRILVGTDYFSITISE